MKNLILVVLASFAYELSAANENWPFTATGTERDLSAIANCIAALSENAPFLVDGDRPKQYSILRIMTGTLFGDAVLTFSHDGCRSEPYDFHLISNDCFTNISCRVDLETNGVVYLQAPKAMEDGRLIEYVNVEDYGPEWPALHWELRESARDGEVVVWARKTYEHAGRWVQVGNTKIECETVVKYISGWDEAIRDSHDDG